MDLISAMRLDELDAASRAAGLDPAEWTLHTITPEPEEYLRPRVPEGEPARPAPCCWVGAREARSRSSLLDRHHARCGDDLSRERYPLAGQWQLREVRRG